jgi:hypothetical protein
MAKTIGDLIREYFHAHPRQNLEHGPVVDWVTEQWLKEHSTAPRDPWRSIRRLHQQGELIKVAKGVYRYDPDAVQGRDIEDFTSAQREAIFERDNYRCVICGRGREDGVEIHADHIIPKDLGGAAEISNGQTLCATHNFRKKNYKQTETGKKMFIRLYELAKEVGDRKTQAFCRSILETFEEYRVNDHIDWEP